MGASVMIPVFLLLIPLMGGLAAFFFKDEKAVRTWALFSSLLTLTVSILGLTVFKNASYLQFHASWISSINSSFSVRLDGMGQILCLLTAVSFPLVFISTWNSVYKKPNNFFALMLLMQVGLMGVFVAMDALLFYFWWLLFIYTSKHQGILLTLQPFTILRLMDVPNPGCSG